MAARSGGRLAHHPLGPRRPARSTRRRVLGSVIVLAALALGCTPDHHDLKIIDTAHTGSTTTTTSAGRGGTPTSTPAPALTIQTAPAPPRGTRGYRELEPDPAHLIWSDEFNGSSLDTSIWSASNDDYGDANHELQCEKPHDVVQANGTLTITAERQSTACPGGESKPFTSGFVSSRYTNHFFPRFGHYEMRARIPHGQGIWPAFWLRHREGAGTAEVDIMEYFESTNPGQTTATLHLDHRRNLAKANVKIEDPSSPPEWHVWAVDIAPDPAGVRFTFSLDRVDYLAYVDTQHLWASADANATWDIALNLSVGGNYLGSPDAPLGYLDQLQRCARGGTPPDDCSSVGVTRASFPARYDIDYVRVYSN